LIFSLFLRFHPQAEWLLLLPAFVLVVAYRAYSEQRLRLERLSTLSEATRLVERQVSVEPAMAGVLSNARALLGADLAILQFMGDHAGDPLLEIRDDGSGDVQMLSVEADPRSGVWARVVAENAAVLLSRPIENLRLREHFSTVGIRDAVVVPLPGRHGVIGTLMVANRSGDVETFTAESTKLLETFAHQIGTALENVRLVAKLQLTADQLGEAVRSKDEMLANIAHDMRNPLASVLAGVHLLLDDEALSRDEQQELLRAIAMQGGSLRSLIDEIVGNASESSREPVPVDLPSLLRTVEATTRAAARGHRLEIACDKFLPEVVSDPAAMSRILGNLVTNAFKYSPDGSSVILSVRADSDGHVLFSVSDEGFGIEPEDQSRIFDRFFQADRANNGAGLGLSIASRLAREIGGQLWLAWSDVGRGSEFRFKVPTRALGPVLTIPDQVSKESLDRA
jgi:signal transduction histidine kinase